MSTERQHDIDCLKLEEINDKDINKHKDDEITELIANLAMEDKSAKETSKAISHLEMARKKELDVALNRSSVLALEKDKLQKEKNNLAHCIEELEELLKNEKKQKLKS